MYYSALFEEEDNAVSPAFSKKSTRDFLRTAKTNYLSANTSDFILDDSKVLEEIVNSDGVMLFEKIGKSKYEDIAKEIERCKNFGVKILGAIVVE